MRFKSKIDVQTINLDWFSCNLRGSLPALEQNQQFERGNVCLIPFSHGTKHFNNMARVFFEGYEIGEIKYNPRNNVVIDSNTIIFKANNQCLYQNSFFNDIESVFQQLELAFSHLTQLDIACDGVGFMQPLILADNNQIEWTGKGMFQPFKKNKSIGMSYEGFWLGSKKGDKFGRCYMKKREIDKSGKIYIENYWKENDLFSKSGTTDIERLEFSLKNKTLARFIPRNGWKKTKELLTDKSFLSSLFYSASKGLYSFREKRKKATQNVSRLKKYFKLNFVFTTVNLLEKIISVSTKRLRAFKTTVKTMYELALKTGVEYYEKQALEIATNINHLHWYQSRRDDWDREFVFHQKNKLSYIPMFTTQLIQHKAGKFFKDMTQYITQDQTQIDSILKFWRK